MELFAALFMLTGAFVLFLIAIPVGLLLVGYDMTVSFISEHWLGLLLFICLLSVVVYAVPVRRTENQDFVNVYGNVITARNYVEFFVGCIIISAIALFFAQVF